MIMGCEKEDLKCGFVDPHKLGLKPLESLDVNKCDSALKLVQAMGKTSFGGRTVGEAHEVLYRMIKDPDCTVVMTLSGAMTIAKMGLVISEMIDRGYVDAIVSTGALMAHGFVEAAGMEHFKYEFGQMDDKELFKKDYNRVYDTLELEKNLDDAEVMVNEVLESFPEGAITCSYELNNKLGEFLVKKFEGRGVLKSAFEKNVPVFIPAFTDSEFGLDFGLFNRKQKMDGKKELMFNPFLDLEKYTDMIYNAKKIGIFTIGGGVPRNWAQQVAPYLDIIRFRLIDNSKSGRYYAPKDSPWNKRFYYGVRICPEPVHWGGLSGCTYEEGVSWGKFVPKEEGGMWAEVHADATIVWPLLLRSVIERIEQEKN